MKILCAHCLELYNIDDFPHNRECEGPLALIDDQLAHIILQFWKLGVSTKFSCAGHLEELQMAPYIIISNKILEFAQELYDSNQYPNIHLLTLPREKDHFGVYIDQNKNPTPTLQRKIVLQSEFLRFLVDLLEKTPDYPTGQKESIFIYNPIR